jgi:hypothetical protein
MVLSYLICITELHGRSLNYFSGLGSEKVFEMSAVELLTFVPFWLAFIDHQTVISTNWSY